MPRSASRPSAGRAQRAEDKGTLFMPSLIDLQTLVYVGNALSRPECVLATSSGRILTCDWRGGIVQIRPDGHQEFIGCPLEPGKSQLLPNGIALLPDGSILAANLSDRGGVWRVTADGGMEPHIVEADGEPLPPANFVAVDRWGRTWITVSTRKQPRSLANRFAADDGFIVMKDEKGSRIVADGFGFTNEVGIDPAGEWLYVNETFGRRLSRLPIRSDGSLGAKEVVVQFGHGTYPDGLAFDGEGAIWITSVISNRIIRVKPGEKPQILLEDSDPDHVQSVEDDFLADRFGPEHFTSSSGRYLTNISSLAFGGPDLRTVYIGSLGGTTIASFRSPIPGHPPVHWDW